MGGFPLLVTGNGDGDGGESDGFGYGSGYIDGSGLDDIRILF